MRDKSLTIILLISFIILGLIGCGQKKMDFNIVIHNVGAIKIERAKVVYDDFYFRGGVVIPRTSKTELVYGGVIPEIATVSWEDSLGEMHEKTVVVKDNLPDWFKGKRESLIFKIDDKNEVSFVVEPPFEY